MTTATTTQAENTTAVAPAAAVVEPSLEEIAAKLFADDAPVSASAGESDESNPAPPTAESPAEPAAETAPDPKAESIAKRIAIAKRAEIRGAQERAELKAERETIEREKAQIAAERKRYELLAEDPVKAFEVLGIEPKTFLEKLAGEHAPENVQAKKLAALEAELTALREERTREHETAKQRELRLQSEHAWTEASAGFVKHVEAGAERFPHLVAEYSEHEAVAAAERALLEVVGYDDKNQPVTRAEAYRIQFGDYPDNDAIAEYLDQQAKARSEARQNSAWRARGQSANSASQAVSPGDPNPAAHPVKGSSPRTLTSRAASEKAAAPKGQRTQEEIDAESIRILQSAFRD